MAEERVPWEVEREGFIRALGLMEREIQKMQGDVGQMLAQRDFVITLLLNMHGGTVSISKVQLESCPAPKRWELRPSPIDGFFTLAFMKDEPAVLVPGGRG